MNCTQTNFENETHLKCSLEDIVQQNIEIEGNSGLLFHFK